MSFKENMIDLANELKDFAIQGMELRITKDNISLLLINSFFFIGLCFVLIIFERSMVYGITLFIFLLIYWFIFLYIRITVKNKAIFINTEYGKCSCKLKKYNWDNYQLWIYYEKLTNQNSENKNIFKRIKNHFKQKYSKLLIIKGYKTEMTDIYNQMKTQPYKRYSIENIVKNFDLKITYTNLEHTKDKININKSNIAKLGELPFIDKENAVKIVMHIQKNGEFESIWDFAEFINLSQVQVNLLLKYAYVEKTDLKEGVFKIEENNLKGDDPSLDI